MVEVSPGFHKLHVPQCEHVSVARLYIVGFSLVSN